MATTRPCSFNSRANFSTTGVLPVPPTVRLPIANPVAGETLRSTNRHAIIPLDESPFTGLQVLLVEDDDDARELLSVVLTEEGAQVTSVASVRHGLEALGSSPFDLLISDIGLPEIDGYDLIQRVRREPSPGRDIPAIALTAYARTEDRTRALRAGYQAHIAKPVEPNELLAMIASFVGLTGAGRRAH